MTVIGERTCYVCGRPADDANDHVPPEVLYDAGAAGSYKRPVILTAPACQAHNRGTSEDDESFAWIVSGAAMLSASAAATVVHQHLMSKLETRLWDRSFTDPRLAHAGVKILRSPSDYDENGNAIASTVTEKHLDAIRTHVRDELELSARTIRKIAAGMVFHATGAKTSLGEERVASIRVELLGFKKMLPNGDFNPTAEPATEAEFFGGLPTIDNWTSVSSGSPEVFQCWVSAIGKSFGVRLLFYERFHAWARSDS